MVQKILQHMPEASGSGTQQEPQDTSWTTHMRDPPFAHLMQSSVHGSGASADAVHPTNAPLFGPMPSVPVGDVLPEFSLSGPMPSVPVGHVLPELDLSGPLALGPIGDVLPVSPPENQHEIHANADGQTLDEMEMTCIDYSPK